MSGLTIDRLHLRLCSARPLPSGRVDAWTDAVAALDADALTGGLASGEEWVLVRRLRLRASWAEDAVGIDAALRWQPALQAAFARALADADDDAVVRYASRRDAQADLLYRSAQGDRGRQWAWHRMGLLDRADASPAQALAQGVAGLLQAPEAVWPVVARLVRSEPATASLAAVLRMLPANAWMTLLKAAPRSRGHVLALSMPADAAGAHPDPAQASADLRASADARRLLAWAATRPELVERQHDTLAVLAASLARDAAGLPSMQARAMVAAARAALGSRDRDIRHAVSAPAAAPVADDPTAPPMRERPGGLPPLPMLEPVADEVATAWGGALFWLARTGPDAMCEDDADEPRVPLALRLLAIAQALGVPPDDAATRAFCGGAVPDEPVPPAFVARAQVLVALWSDWLADAAPDLPEPRIEAVCRRRGRLRLEPGWIELRLPLESADVRVRRLGLDLDPGWIPWLGCVLRIRYDQR